MKFCRGCNQSLDESFFTKCSRAPDRLDWRCRQCKQRHTEKYLDTEKARATRRAWAQKNRAKVSERKRERRAEYAAQNPERVRAQQLVGNAVRRGFMPKPEEKPDWWNRWEFHHPDTSRPYYGVWLNPSDHRLVENGKKSCPPCTDHTEDVRRCLLTAWGLE
jgi:hypothetical protein